MNTSLINKRKRDKNEFSLLKKKPRLLTVDKDCENKFSKKNKIERFLNSKFLEINGNSLKNRIKKNKNKSIELEISNNKINNHYMTLAHSKDKKDKNKFLNSVKIDVKEKNNKISNRGSFVIYNYSTIIFDKNKNLRMKKEKKNSNKINNNITYIKKNFFEQKLYGKETNKKNKNFYFSQINSKKVTNAILKTTKNPKKKLTKNNNKNKNEISNMNNKTKNRNKKILNIIKNNKEKALNQKTNIESKNNNFKKILYSDQKSAPLSSEKGFIEINPTNISTIENNNNNYNNKPSKKNNNKNEYMRDSFKSKNDSNSLNISYNQKNYSLTQPSKISKSRKNKYKNFDNRHLIYKTELNLNNEMTKDILSIKDNSLCKIKEKNYDKQNKANRYLSPINVHRNIFSFKKNEIIDITNKNNYIVITKKKFNSPNKKKEFCDYSYKKEISCDESNNNKILEDNFEFIPKHLVIYCDQMKEMNITIKPRKDLELKLFRHIKRNSVI